jgi:hypothetical protein
MNRDRANKELACTLTARHWAFFLPDVGSKEEFSQKYMYGAILN